MLSNALWAEMAAFIPALPEADKLGSYLLLSLQVGWWEGEGEGGTSICTAGQALILRASARSFLTHSPPPPF